MRGVTSLTCATGERSRDRYEVDVRAFFRASMIDLPKFKIVVPISEVQGLQLEQEVTGLKFLELVKRVLANGKLSIRGRSITLTIVQSFSDNSTLAKVHNLYMFPQLAKFFGTTDYHAWGLANCHGVVTTGATFVGATNPP